MAIQSLSNAFMQERVRLHEGHCDKSNLMFNTKFLNMLIDMMLYDATYVRGEKKAVNGNTKGDLGFLLVTLS